MSHWPAALALLAVGGIYLLVSDRLTLGPSWLLLVVVLVLLGPRAVAHRRGLRTLARRLGLVVISIVTLLVAASAVFLVSQLMQGAIAPSVLLLDAALIWAANVLTFAVWYWEIDGGGPLLRHPRLYVSQDFLFPQMVSGGKTEDWLPGFVDYLFLAFNTSTAFSPTDTLILSQRAKLLMMAQSLISLLTATVLIARAINTL
jgi:uncharacterized membrane protein